MDSADSKLNRREFLQKGAAVAAGGAAMSSSALSYSRIVGANDRISLGHIGVGNRGTELDGIVAFLKDKEKVEVSAVCDVWTLNLERAVANNQKYYGKAPRTFKHPRELLALKDLDGVMISTPEHSHSPILKLTAEAGKDAYCEKPMGNVLEEVRGARDAVLARNLITQIGTQHRSEPYQIAARDLIRTGALGEVSKYEMDWDYHGPRWLRLPGV